MAHSLSAIAFLAPEYDAAIAWFRDTLGFVVIEDTPLGGGKRWVVVGDPAGQGARFVIARAEGGRQLAAVGAQAGGRVGYFVETDDFAAEHKRLTDKGVEFLESPRRESYGVVAVFKDPWGGKWDLIQTHRAVASLPFERQLRIWGALFGGIFVLVATLGSEIAPFAFGIALGYLLNPVAHRLQRLGFSRLTASLLILLAFLGVVGFAGVALAPTLLRQIALFTTKLPGWIESLQTWITTDGAQMLAKHGGP